MEINGERYFSSILWIALPSHSYSHFQYIFSQINWARSDCLLEYKILYLQSLIAAWFIVIQLSFDKIDLKL